MKKKNTIREGDRVRIITPQIVIRVGYPKAVADYLEEATTKYQLMLEKEMPSRCVEKVLQQIAYGLAKADGFGGTERSLHLKEVPELKGQEFTVSGVRTVQTGTYYPPHSSVSYFGEYDWTPGGLENMRARRLASGFMVMEGLFSSMVSEIPVEHLEKII